MAVLSLHFCARAFSSCGKWGPLFIAVRGPLTIASSLVAEHRLKTRRLRNCGSRAQLLRGMWDLPSPGLEPVSPALAGRFSTTVPPGKPNTYLSYKQYCHSITIQFASTLYIIKCVVVFLKEQQSIAVSGKQVWIRREGLFLSLKKDYVTLGLEI